MAHPIGAFSDWVFVYHHVIQFSLLFLPHPPAYPGFLQQNNCNTLAKTIGGKVAILPQIRNVTVCRHAVECNAVRWTQRGVDSSMKNEIYGEGVCT